MTASNFGTHNATLIAPARGALDDAALERAAAALPAAGKPGWLAQGRAADISFSADSAIDHREMADRLRGMLPGVDVVVQPAANRRKKLLLADMDSTMIAQECLDELADYAGLKPNIAAITERAMRGEIEFEPALRERVAMLKGVAAAAIGEIIENRITLTPGAKTLVATMKKHGAHTCLVTGGFTQFAERIGTMIGFNETRANRLKLDPDGHLSGLIEEPIFGRDAKHAALIELRDKHGLQCVDTLAVGDGANDMDMIAEAGLGVAFHAKPRVAAAAPARIDHGDLTALLYAQGYRENEFVPGNRSA
ncbi:MAG: phosphoserine phosphatase SerB [Pseudolabrys sp.]